MPYGRIGKMFTLEPYSDAIEIDNPCLIMTLDNVLLFQCEVTVTDSAATLFTLPEEARPLNNIAVPVCVNEQSVSGVLSVNPLVIMTTGEVIASTETGSDYTVFLNGVCVNLANTYFNSEIGNDYLQGTDPGMV